jgi:hypothetical protein
VADNSGFVVLSSLICKKNEKVVQTCFSVTWHQVEWYYAFLSSKKREGYIYIYIYIYIYVEVSRNSSTFSIARLSLSSLLALLGNSISFGFQNTHTHKLYYIIVTKQTKNLKILIIIKLQTHNH